MKFSVIFEAQLADPTVERERRLFHDSVRCAVPGPTVWLSRRFSPS
ncbi:hypothetical protein [Streptomyces gilvosporeus]|nr:hypothetical protein [Streptomyces gilvosporeus]